MCMGSHAISSSRPTVPTVEARRRVLRLAVEVAAASAAVAFAAACGGRATCDDTSGLSADDARARRDHKYADTGPDPSKRCAGCAQFKGSPKEDTCGACEVLKGPVSPLGTCDLFAPKR